MGITSLAELDHYFDRMGLPPSGRHLLTKAFKSGPVRNVHSSGVNVTGEVQSEKMGTAIPYESGSLEFPAIVQYEHDSDVVAYFAQPFRLDLKLTDGGTRRAYRVAHTPDFLVLSNGGAFVDEWKEPKVLERILRDKPGRLTCESDGWHWPEVEEYLAGLGLIYRLRTRAEFSERYVDNLRFLAEYFSSSAPPPTPQAAAALKEAFGDDMYVSLDALLARARPATRGPLNRYDEDAAETTTEMSSFSTDDIYKSIVLRQVAFDLRQESLSEPSCARIYRDATTMAFYARLNRTPELTEVSRSFTLTPGDSVVYDGVLLQVSMMGGTNVVLRNDTDGSDVEVAIDSLQRLFQKGRITLVCRNHDAGEDNNAPCATTAELDAALTRAEMLDWYKTNPSRVLVSRRTIQRWRRAMEDAGDSALDQNLALVPRVRFRGNRNAKLGDTVVALIQQVASEHFNTPTGISKRVAYRHFVDACTKNDVVPCSQKTFNRRLIEHVNHQAREGRRLADKKTPLPLYVAYGQSVHGVRPFEYVHFDHTEVDLELKSPEGVKLRKAWLSLAICTATRKIVGFYLSFRAPSYVSCLMLMRDIVRRHGRLPEMIVVDNGADFKSKSFKRVCRLYRVHLRYRPKGRPRYGSVMERMFGVTNTQFVHNLSGNTKLMKHVRSVTRAVHPSNFVEWTLVALHGGLEYFFESLYGQNVHPAYNESPNERFLRLMHEAGARVHRWVRYDRTFRIETCPAPDGAGTRVVDQVRGVKVNNAYYMSDKLCAPRLHGKEVDVRVEPWDPSVVYVCINNEWVTCRSRVLAQFAYKSELELRYAIDEAATRAGLPRVEATPQRVQEWLRVLKAENFDERLRIQQDETRLIYGPLNMLTADVTEYPVERAPQAQARASSPGDSEDMPAQEEYEVEIDLLR